MTLIILLLLPSCMSSESALANSTKLIIKNGLMTRIAISLTNANVHHRVEMGRIDLLTNFSYFEVPEQDARFVIKDMNGADWKGRKVAVSVANADSSPEEKASRKKERKSFKEFKDGEKPRKNFKDGEKPFEKFRKDGEKPAHKRKK